MKASGSMQHIVQIVRNNIHVVVKILPIISLTIPFLILYFFQNIAFPPYPQYYYKYTDTFEVTWKGRTYYIFFLWLALMETILSWNKLQPIKFGKQAPLRTAVFVLCLLFPTVYVVIANFQGLNRAIVDWTYALGIRTNAGCDWMPLAIEYLVFATLFALIVLTQYGFEGIRNVIISPVFVATMGAIFMIDNIYPWGAFTPFQIFVPTAAILAANVLGSMGYSTELRLSGQMPLLTAWNSNGLYNAYIGWPCAGVDSLIIYTVTILLFLRDTSIPLFQRAIYFTVGALVTYFINIFRIVTIFIIGVNSSRADVELFHNFYGSFYSILWIMSYPFIIIGSRILWSKIRQWETRTHSLSSS